MKRRSIALAIVGMSLVVGHGFSSPWPQLGCDEYRSNRTVDSPVAPFTKKWEWTPRHNEWMAGHVQPVIANNIVVVGSLDGHIYGISGGPSGNGSTLWEYQTGGPIAHTAALADVSGWKCYVPSSDGYLYALTLSSGGLVWRYRARGAILVAPLFVQGRLYVGDNRGFLHCVDAATGARIWETRLGPSIQCCPTWGAGGKIFTATEDMYAHAVSAANGAILWSRHLPGQGFMLYWPVYSSASNHVVFRTRKITPNGQDVLEDDILNILRQYPDAHNNDAYYTAAQEAIRTYYVNRPWLRTFHILNAETGADAFVAPVACVGRHQDCPAPPVLDHDGRFMAVIRTRRSDWYGFSFASGQDENGDWGTIVPSFAKLNASTGLFERIAPYRTFSTGAGRMCCDDQSVFTIAGNFFVMNHRIFSVNNRTTYQQTIIRQNDYTGITWTQGNGLTQNNSYGYNNVVVSDGIMYVHDASVESGATGSVAAIE